MLLLPLISHLLGLESSWWGHFGSGGIEVASLSAKENHM
jgi:hypothetical protein